MTEQNKQSDTPAPGMSRELMGLIVDEVFDGAIEDASVIEEIYAVIKRHEAARQHDVQPESFGIEDSRIAYQRAHAPETSSVAADLPVLMKASLPTTSCLSQLEAPKSCAASINDPLKPASPPPQTHLRALLDEALTVLDTYADPTGYTDGYGDLLPADAEQHEGLLAKTTAEKIRAALATTEGSAE